jgi:hypothetical protein
MVAPGGYLEVSGLVMHGRVKRTGARRAEFRSGRWRKNDLEWDWDDRGNGDSLGLEIEEEGEGDEVDLLHVGDCQHNQWMIIQPVKGTGVQGYCWRRIGMVTAMGRDGKLEEARRTEKTVKRLRLV